MSANSMRGQAHDALLTAARECLIERGFAQTSARDICTRSGANLRSIGYHYGSLRELLLVALSQNFRGWMAPLVAALTDVPEPPRSRIERGLALLIDELPVRAPLVAAWLEAVALSRHDDALRTRLAKNRDTFRTALAETLEEAKATDPQQLADAVMITCDGIFTRYLLYGDAPRPAEVAAILSQDRRLLGT